MRQFQQGVAVQPVDGQLEGHRRQTRRQTIYTGQDQFTSLRRQPLKFEREEPAVHNKKLSSIPGTIQSATQSTPAAENRRIGFGLQFIERTPGRKKAFHN